MHCLLIVASGLRRFRAQAGTVPHSGLSFWLSFKVYLIVCPSGVLSFCLSDIECCVFFCVKSFDS